MFAAEMCILTLWAIISCCSRSTFLEHRPISRHEKPLYNGGFSNFYLLSFIKNIRDVVQVCEILFLIII